MIFGTMEILGWLSAGYEARFIKRVKSDGERTGLGSWERNRAPNDVGIINDGSH